MMVRQFYIDKIAPFVDKGVIKVFTGIRRCGKTTLFELFREQLSTDGVDHAQIIAINFEDPDYASFPDWRTVWEYIKPRIHKDCKTYVFLDEIQYVVLGNHHLLYPFLEMIVDEL